jgi:phosphoribosylamine--glycine ligase
MNVLVLGSGGREHALSWKISQSSLCEKLFIAPGNAGTSSVGQNVDISVNDFPTIKTFALENDINMIVVGPEDPLVNGIYDFFQNDSALSDICLIGPSKEGAKLEGSKDYSKQFMMRHNIPTAAYGSFKAETLKEGCDFLETLNPPYVLKADGLAAGKGVLILDDLETAKAELKSMLAEAKFGKASSTGVFGRN